MNSVVDLSTCGYAKGIISQLSSSNCNIVPSPGESKPLYNSKINKKRFESYCQTFSDHLENFSTDHRRF